MKKLTFIFAMIISTALLFSSCKKAVDDVITDPAANGTGSYSMTIDGNTFTTLTDEVNMVINIVALAGKDHNGVEFVLTLTNVPAIGQTVNICHEDDCGENPFGILYMGDNGNMYTSYEGTVKRTAEKKIETSGKLMGLDGTFHEFSLTINLNVIIG